MRWRSQLSVATAAAAPQNAAQTPAAQSPVFRAGADVVAVEASVRRDRRPLAGLKADDFELLDNGVPQQIVDVSHEKLPIDVTVLLDVSASVTGPALDELRRALRQLRGDLGAVDRLRLVTFNMGMRRVVDFAEPAPASTAHWRRSAAPAAARSSIRSPSRSSRRAGAASADRALQRWPGQQQHHRRGDAPRRREAHDADGRRR